MIKIGYLISYDYKYVFNSIPIIYDEADEIYLAIDINRKTWSGNNFELPKSFFEQINLIDKDSKIHIYEDNFYIKELSPIENDTRERNLLLKKMGKGWLMQIDADEYMCNFKELTDTLRNKKYLTFFYWLFPVTIFGDWYNLFKKTNNGYFQVTNKEPYPFITNYPRYTICRNNINLVDINIGGIVLHHSYARDEKEIQMKFNNWGHTKDFDTEKYFNFWKNINEDNYKDIENFHPLNLTGWEKLKFIKANNIKELLDTNITKEEYDFSQLNGFYILRKNIVIFTRRQITFIKNTLKKNKYIYKLYKLAKNK